LPFEHIHAPSFLGGRLARLWSSKQHAVLQFRFVEKRNEYGDRIGKVKPYLIDLEKLKTSLFS
jgi:hypothetical protein